MLIATHVYLRERKKFSDKEKRGRLKRQWVRGRKMKRGKKKKLQENTDEQSKFSHKA